MSTKTRRYDSLVTAAYRLTFAVDFQARRSAPEMSLDLTFYPRSDQEAAEWEAVVIAMRDGLRAAGREASLELVSEASEVVA